MITLVKGTLDHAHYIFCRSDRVVIHLDAFCDRERIEAPIE